MTLARAALRLRGRSGRSPSCVFARGYFKLMKMPLNDRMQHLSQRHL
jgi:hypothetical protein